MLELFNPFTSKPRDEKEAVKVTSRFINRLIGQINNLVRENTTVDRRELITSSKWAVNVPLQAALKTKNIIQWLSSAATTASIGYGAIWTVAATQSTPDPASTSMLNSINRAVFTTSTISGNASGIRTSTVKLLRGQNGFGGFYYFSRFGFVTVHADMQFMNGVSGFITLLAGEPSAQNNTICIGKDIADVNLQLIFKGTGAAHKINLGIAPVAGDLFTVEFFCPPTENIAHYRVVRLNNRTVVAEGSYSGVSLPVASTPLGIHSVIRTNAVAAVAHALTAIYTEVDCGCLYGQ